MQLCLSQTYLHMYIIEQLQKTAFSLSHQNVLVFFLSCFFCFFLFELYFFVCMIQWQTGKQCWFSQQSLHRFKSCCCPYSRQDQTVMSLHLYHDVAPHKASAQGLLLIKHLITCICSQSNSLSVAACKASHHMQLLTKHLTKCDSPGLQLTVHLAGLHWDEHHSHADHDQHRKPAHKGHGHHVPKPNCSIARISCSNPTKSS